MKDAVKEIENSIQQLSREDFHSLISWLADYENEIWDKEIEEDYKAGKLDKLVNNTLADIKNGNIRAL